MSFSLLLPLLLIHGSHVGNDPTFGLRVTPSTEVTPYGTRLFLRIRNTGPHSVILHNFWEIHEQLDNGDLFLGTADGLRPPFQLGFPCTMGSLRRPLGPGETKRIPIWLYQLPPDEYILRGEVRLSIGYLGRGCAVLPIEPFHFDWPDDPR